MTKENNLIFLKYPHGFILINKKQRHFIDYCFFIVFLLFFIESPTLQVQKQRAGVAAGLNTFLTESDEKRKSERKRKKLFLCL